MFQSPTQIITELIIPESGYESILTLVPVEVDPFNYHLMPPPPKRFATVSHY